MGTMEDGSKPAAVGGVKRFHSLTNSSYQTWKCQKGLISLENDVDVVLDTPSPPRGRRQDHSPLRLCNRSLGLRRHGRNRSNQWHGRSREWHSGSSGSSDGQSREHDQSRESGWSMDGEQKRHSPSRSACRVISGHHQGDQQCSGSPSVRRSHSPDSLQQRKQADWLKNFSFPRSAEVVYKLEKREKKWRWGPKLLSLFRCCDSCFSRLWRGATW